VPLKLTAKLRTDTDRYAGVPQADEDEASASFRAQYYDAADDQALTPFIAYKNTLLFMPTYSPWKQTKNDRSDLEPLTYHIAPAAVDDAWYRLHGDAHQCQYWLRSRRGVGSHIRPRSNPALV
jgi:hypothetical protein